MIYIGTIRRLLLIRGEHKWNAWVRDGTAKLEGTILISDLPWPTRKVRAIERFWFWLAWCLPRSLVYFASIRLVSHATTGEYDTTIVPELSAMDAIKRWEK